MSVRPTDFPWVFAMGLAMGFLYLPPPKDEGKVLKGGHFASMYKGAFKVCVDIKGCVKFSALRCHSIYFIYLLRYVFELTEITAI